MATIPQSYSLSRLALWLGVALLWAGGKSRADAPLITRHPVDQRAMVGEKVRLASAVTSTIPTFFHWYKDGSLVSSSALSFLDINNAQPHDSGLYEMVVQNRDGITHSRLTQVRVMMPNLAAGVADPDFHAGTSDSIIASSATVGPEPEVWLGGSFTQINAQSRVGFARLNAQGSLQPLTGSSFNGSLSVIVPHGNGVLVGGQFSQFDGKSANNLIRLQPNGRSFPINAPAADRLGNFTFADGDVRVILPMGDGRLLIGGLFSQVNGISRPGLAMLQADGSVQTSFLPPAISNGVVRAAAVLADGTLLVGGTFTSPRVRLFRLNANTGTEMPFSAGHASPDGEVRSIISLSDGSIVLGGEFIRLFNTDRKGLGKLLATGALDPNFRVNITGTLSTGVVPKINSLKLDGQSRLLVGGNFTAVKGLPRAGLARVSLAGVVDADFVGPQFDKPLRDIHIQPNGKVLVGGDFEWPRSHVMRLLAEAPAAFAPQFLQPSTSAPAASGGGANVSAIFASAGTTSFQWKKNGFILPGKARRELFLDSLANADAGTYTLQAANQAGTTESPALAVSVLPPPSGGVQEYAFPADLGASPLSISEVNLTDSVLAVPPSLTIDKISIRLDIRHPDTSQLVCQLVAPNGLSISLFSQPGRGGADFDQTVLDSESPFALVETGAPYLGSLRPIGNLSSLTNSNAQGQWRLRLQDMKPDDGLTGSLVAWSLLVRTNTAQTYAAYANALPAGQRNPLDDADGDGIPNIVESALVDEPPIHETHPQSLAVSYRRWSRAQGYSLAPQVSPDLQKWSLPNTSQSFTTIRERLADGTERVLTEFFLPQAGKAQFFRLGLELSP